MKLLTSYRQQLADEAAGRSHRFADILRYFRAFWLGSVVLGLALGGWLMWAEVREPSINGGGWGLLIGPILATLVIVAGRIPYGLAQLFLSVKDERNG